MRTLDTLFKSTEKPQFLSPSPFLSFENQQCTVIKNMVGVKWMPVEQRKHTKLESLLNDEDFKEECQA
ncbi:hypothetical protein RhiirC2_790780 [Rhizophagus irregularis]|uniref:Uncharacterized protein n=1 Tax=Rhizophagus irregularis TaxID=588596 RepID=A0A2N1MKJ5_9GLOM|nr:hypothetical protein RhiirC2_790780 [Rhizophagus irregularis]